MDLDELLDGAPKVVGPEEPIDDFLNELLSAEENTTATGTAVGTSDAAAPFEGLACEVVEIPRLRRAPDNNAQLMSLYPVSIKPFRQPPPHVKIYMTNTCYYANQVTIITNFVTREKRGLVVNESNVYIMTDDTKILRTIPLTQIEAVIMQDISTPKALGLSKEVQTHVVLQTRDLPDLFFALSEDMKKDPATGRAYGENIPALEVVLRELLLSYEIDLPICKLGNSESIDKFIKRGLTDQTMRRRCAEALAYRTSLVDKLKSLIQRNADLISARDEIEASSASPVVRSLLKEAESIDEKKTEITLALKQTDVSINKCRQKEEELRASIKAMEENRQVVVREKVAQLENETISRQAVEFELMQHLHQTEMRNLTFLRTFLQSRAERRRNFPPVSAGEVEADVAELRRLLKVVASRKDAATENLTEVKQRLHEAKTALRKVTEEVETLRRLPQKENIPQDFNREMAPTFLRIYLPDDELCNQQTTTTTTTTPVAAPAAPQGRDGAVSGKAAGVVLTDDDDDDIDLLLPQPQPNNNKQNRSPIILDDDDL